jgi:hypothetical protein
MKTAKLTGAALDWAVANCEGLIKGLEHGYAPSSNWAQGGVIIERERIEIEHDGFEWWARIQADDDFNGATLLVAAMRCYVASKLGDEVEVPDELLDFVHE